MSRSVRSVSVVVSVLTLALIGLQASTPAVAADSYPPASGGGGLPPTPTESPTPTPEPTATASATPTPSPTASQTPAPTVSYAAVPPAELSLGTATAVQCSGTTCVPVEVTKTVTQEVVTLSVSTGVTLQLRPVASGGTPAQVSSDGTLVIPAAGGLTITLSGLTPGTFVDVYLNSDRIFVGKAKVAADGTVNATLPLPSGVPVGEHTAQIVGTDYTGKVISASLGIVVKGAVPATANRFTIVGVAPAAGTKLAQRSRVEFKASLFGIASGTRLTASSVAKLAACTMRLTVKTSAGKTLLASTCMAYGKTDGKASYKWTVPTAYKGKVKAVFTFKETGRAAASYSRMFTIG